MGKIVYVKFFGTVSTNTLPKNKEFNPVMESHAVGFLLEEDDTKITIAMVADEYGHTNVMSIPQPMILLLQEIR